MSKVIDFEGRKKIKRDEARTGLLQNLKSILRCGHCQMRCAKCGAQSEPTSLVSHERAGVAFRVCPACKDEYEALVDYLDHGRDPEAPEWFNREWIRQWLAWIDYQAAFARYVGSPEVLAALDDLYNQD